MGIQRYGKISLFLFGGLMFGYNIGVYLHELSHALAMIWLGGSVDRIEMNPFATSYTYYASTPSNPVLTSWAGIALGPLLALFIYGFCILVNNDYLILLSTMVLVGSLAMNGAYALIDSYLTHYGDPSHLIVLGVPREEIAGVGGLLLTCMLLLTAFLGETLGFQASDGVIKRALVLGAGILPYFAIDAIFAAFVYREESPGGNIAMPIALTCIIIIAILSRIIQPRVRLQIARPVAEMHWGAVFLTLVLGIGFVALEFLYI